ncbi:MAG: MFS transporter [Chloroflexi bacterium]|jgi:hypothetical protein|nr:MFS transporter [Anaerolineaceae bacterium]NLI45391.1 MFS transporter [Chloroflexota bacterium]HOE34374.1 MFS transporter [Anaerolineaceae bacterium]HOT26365.1 MFS transporter [Anaerolineaceae bacterium]HQH57289.1 MFS transporter [Anaerolineaceae bacterium]
MPSETNQLRRNILIFSVYFLVFFAGMGFIQPFLSLHFRSIGFSGVQVGALGTFSSLGLILTATQYGLFFDRSSRKRLILALSLLLAALTLFFLPYLRVFGMALVLFIAHRIITSSSITATENLSYQVSSDGATHGKPSFGRLRLWGSVGFGITAVIGGWLFGTRGVLVNDQLFLAFMLVSIGIILFVMPADFFRDGKADQKSGNPAGLKGIISLIFRDRYLLLTVLALALTDTLSDGVRSFEPIFMKDLGLTESIIGAAVSLSCFLEVPMMLLADRWIQKLEVHQLVYFILIFDLTRRLLVWFLPFPWLVFTLNILTAVSFTLRLVTTIHLINLRVPRQYTTTAVTFVSITLNGISHMLSNALSGVVYDNFGGRPIYLVSACFCVISLFLALAARRAKAHEDAVLAGNQA